MVWIRSVELLPKALERIMMHPNYWFKFVISNEEDMKEIEEDFIKPFNIPPKRVLMMPGLDKQENYHVKNKILYGNGQEIRIYRINSITC